MISADQGFDKVTLGAFDMVFLYCYAMGLFMAGHLEDKFPLKYVLPGGMLGSALMLALMALLGWMKVTASWPFYLAWAFTGIF
jgi:sugar phosphate permease